MTPAVDFPFISLVFFTSFCSLYYSSCFRWKESKKRLRFASKFLLFAYWVGLANSFDYLLGSNECKRRKIKCNGQVPCQRCGHLNLECMLKNHIVIGTLFSLLF